MLEGFQLDWAVGHSSFLFLLSILVDLLKYVFSLTDFMLYGLRLNLPLSARLVTDPQCLIAHLSSTLHRLHSYLQSVYWTGKIRKCDKNAQRNDRNQSGQPMIVSVWSLSPDFSPLLPPFFIPEIMT